ncbi:MAG: multidrug efflux system membrane fusion protein [Oleispira sp.]|jgi:multidrug efflux system membrane fusion protein
MTHVKCFLFSTFVSLSLSSVAYGQQSIVGLLEANKSSIISSELSGLVKNVHVSLGDVVTQGDLLASLDDVSFALQVKLAESEVSLSQAEYSANQRQLKRISGLEEKGNASVSELDDSNKLFEVGSAQLSVARAQLALSKNTLEKTKILAPYSGWVSARFVEQGQLLSPASEMFELLDIQTLKVVFYLLESDIRHVDKNQKIDVVIPAVSAQKRQAVIAHIGAKQYTGQAGYRVEAIIDNSDFVLRPDFTARIQLAMPSENNLGD